MYLFSSNKYRKHKDINNKKKAILCTICWTHMLSLKSWYTKTTECIHVCLCVFVFSCGRGWFQEDSPAPPQKSESHSPHRLMSNFVTDFQLWIVSLLWNGTHWPSRVNIWSTVSVYLVLTLLVATFLISLVCYSICMLGKHFRQSLLMITS